MRRNRTRPRPAWCCACACVWCCVCACLFVCVCVCVCVSADEGEGVVRLETIVRGGWVITGGWTESTDKMVRTMNAVFLSVIDCVFCVASVCFVNASSLHCSPLALQTLSQDCPLPPRTQSCRLGGDISCLRTRSLPMMAEIMSCEVVASLKMVYE